MESDFVKCGHCTWHSAPDCRAAGRCVYPPTVPEPGPHPFCPEHEPSLPVSPPESGGNAARSDSELPNRTTREQRSKLRSDIASAINRASRENVSNTPDFVLAKYLSRCLAAFEDATNERERLSR